MSSMNIQESFEVQAPKERVFAFLADPEQCFPCLPGATFGQRYPDGKFDGKIAVAVGPVRVSYDGWASYEEEDLAAGRLLLAGEGRETGGAGLVTLSMTCTVTETDGTSRVEVDAEVGLAGKIIRFGRGLVRSIASQVFQDFTARARSRLEQTPATEVAPAPDAAFDPFGGAPAPAPPATPAPTATAPAAPFDPFAAAPEPAPAAPAPAAPAPAAPAPAAAPTPAVPASAPAAAAPAPAAPALPAAPPEENAPANGLSLLFRAIAAMIGNFFRGLFGGSSR